MNLKKLKTYNLKELQKEYIDRANKLKEYELNLRSGKEKDTSKVKHLRRDVARVLTLLNTTEFLAKLDSEVVATKEPKIKEVKIKKIKIK